MKQIVTTYSYSPTTNVVTLTGVNIDADQLLLVVAPQVGRTMYNFASVTGVVSAGADTRVTLNASTAGLTTTSPLVIFYDDQASTQTIAGTVTANGLALGQEIANVFPIGVGQVGGDGVRAVADFSGYYVPVAVREIAAISGTVTVGNSVTVAGTVTANVVGQDEFGLAQPLPLIETDGTANATRGFAVSSIIVDNDGYSIFNNANGSRGIPIAGRSDAGIDYITAENNRLDTNVKNSVTIGSLPAISGTVTATVREGQDAIIHDPASAYTSVRAQSHWFSDSDNELKATSENYPLPISGTVTVGAMPNGSLTTRFGSVTTANTAEATSAVTNAYRKYLLIQNVTTSSNVITVGIGFTPTTTQGIQLTAGAGITFESSYIPTGAVMILSSVTASPFTVLEA